MAWLKLEVGTSRDGSLPGGESSFFGGVKADVSPYLRALLVDFIISVCLWFAFFVFQWITQICPIQGYEGERVIVVHALSMTLAFATFGLKFTYDVIVISRRANR